jgi:hypothetical protein
MTSEECHLRARVCAANAEVSHDVAIASQFMKLAVQWRAMAVGERSLGEVADEDVCGPSESGGDAPAK